MSRKLKTYLIIALSLTCIGIILFGGAMSLMKFDFVRLSTKNFQTKEYTISENFKNVSIVTDVADVTIVVAEDYKTTIECHEYEKTPHSVKVNDDTLTITVSDTSKWYEKLSIGFTSPKLIITLPKKNYGNLTIKSDTGDVKIAKDFNFNSIDIEGSTGDVTSYASALNLIKIKTSTGSIALKNVSAGDLELSVSTGSISIKDSTCKNDASISVSTGKTILTDLNCKNLSSTGSTGKITLTDVIATNSISIKRSTGSVIFERCDAGEMDIETNTGDIKGSLLTGKTFIYNTNTGDVLLPETTGNICNLTTRTGDIKITIE